MRTTLDLDDDVLDAVRSLAQAQGQSVGFVVSELIRRALEPTSQPEQEPDGFATFEPPSDKAPLTVEMVRAAVDDEA